MLGLLPDWLRERIQDQLDRIIHASMALAVTFTGMSLEDLVLIIPALVSVSISILAWIAKGEDRKRRMEIYRQEEEKRTEAMLKYLDEVKGKPSSSAAVLASQAISKASKMGMGGIDEQG
jgi:hypothetical protein